MIATPKPVRPFGDFLRILIAPAIWFAHFSGLYAADALICIGPPAGQGTTMAWTAFLATAAALTGLIILGAGLRHSRKISPQSESSAAWLRRTSLMLALLSALGVIWTTLPTAMLPACAS